MLRFKTKLKYEPFGPPGNFHPNINKLEKAHINSLIYTKKGYLVSMSTSKSSVCISVWDVNAENSNMENLKA